MRPGPPRGICALAKLILDTHPTPAALYWFVKFSTAATSSATATYTEDIWGNLYSIAPSGSPAWQNGLSLGILTNNRISGDGYDAAGNMTSDGLYNYRYNAENQQTTAAGVNYYYDGDGKRVMKSNGTLYWYGEGSEVLAETDLSGNNFNEYAYFGGRRMARGRDSDGAAWHYFQDHLGSSRVIVQYGGSAACYDADFYPYGGGIRWLR